MISSHLTHTLSLLHWDSCIGSSVRLGQWVMIALLSAHFARNDSMYVKAYL
jgi:hypothetical protein